MNNNDSGLSHSKHNVNIFRELSDSVKSEPDAHKSMLLVAQYSDQLIRSAMSDGFVKGIFVGVVIGLGAAIISVLVAT